MSAASVVAQYTRARQFGISLLDVQQRRGLQIRLGRILGWVRDLQNIFRAVIGGQSEIFVALTRELSRPRLEAVVLAHQTQMHNLITQTNYQTRIALYKEPGQLSEAGRVAFERPAEQLVRYLLFANEAHLEEPVSPSRFAEEFAARGPRDARGRSLRDFDLRTRIFKYPCSYLIYSEDFDAIPEPAKSYVYRRLFEVLTGREQGPEFASLSAGDRRAILEILIATKPGLPDEWKQFIAQKEEPQQ